jgi:predicted HAD superfamily Cof-like phosphohydrolase
MSKKVKFEDGDLQVRAYNENTMDAKLSSKYWNVPFVNEVEEFNETMGKPNNYYPTIPDKKDWMFVYDFIQEELAEYKEACEKGDIVEVLDALCDIAYVSLGNGTMLHGLKGHIWKAYKEVQASNMSKSCENIEVAEDTIKVRSEQQGEPCHWEKVGDRYIVYRTRDRKVMKSVNYFRPNLKQFFTKEDLDNV